jgi:hypothetical protein
VTFFTADTGRGILDMPFGWANNNYYGIDRQGPNLFANSLAARSLGLRPAGRADSLNSDSDCC